MKKFLLLLPALGLMSSFAGARDLSAQFTWATFNTSDQKPYIETYLSVYGKTLTYVKKANGKYQGALDVVITFTQHDSIKAMKKYSVNSPELADTAQAVNFVDLQRIPLLQGDYTLNLTIADPNRKDGKAVNSKQNFSVAFSKDSVNLSNIELIESYKKATAENTLTKSGYDIVPYVSTFYPANMNMLSFYTEIYNTQKVFAAEEKFLVLSYIESDETKARMSQYSRFTKQAPQRVNVLFAEFPIEALPTGRYNLVIEVRNSTNRLLATRKVTIDRLNPGVQRNLEDLASVNTDNTFVSRINNKDSLSEYIRCLRPISTEAEKNFAENRIKEGDMQVMRQYLYNYWVNRNDANPEAAFKLYNVEVQKVQKAFGTQTLKGYQTDRGRVYLQYGPPDQRTVSNSEPSSYPYEIWQYYTLKPTVTRTTVSPQTNKKFVFYNTDLVTNNYQLLHSDARGEVRDDQWQLKLVNRNTHPNNFDETKQPDDYGNQADDLFKNPH